MTTTTVIDTGQRSSVLSPHWQTQMTVLSPLLMASPPEKFPKADDESPKTTAEPRSLLTATPTLVRHPEGQWSPRKNGIISHELSNASKQRPRRSISQTIGSIRARRLSVNVNAQELAEALKAPVSYKLISLFLIWYMTSALTNTSSKSILVTLQRPITLTIVQFGFVSMWCLVLAYLASAFPTLRQTIPALRNGIRYPSADVISTVLPLALFQLAGHILSSIATSQIPVSLVHTIKGLSPLFTVLAYRFLFRIRYARATYLSLVPLTLGVMLACSAGFSTDFYGILCAFGAALVFVSQNIFSKKLFNEASSAESEGQSRMKSKLDKLNLLCYCSGLAFILTAPIWFLSEGYPLIVDFVYDGAIDLSGKKGSLDHGPLLLEFIFNGIFHFAQNILAFVLLSMISPVSYSVASLIKRVFVIAVAIIWFGNPTTPLQAFGIGLTFIGLYLYDRTSHHDAADRRANADHFQNGDSVLPLSTSTAGKSWNSNGHAFPFTTIIGLTDNPAISVQPSVGNPKRQDEDSTRLSRRSSLSRPSLLPGTKQESTWQPGDSQPSQ